jgi:hypothetical protein
MTIQRCTHLPLRTVMSRTRAWVGNVLVGVAAFSFLAACDGGSQCSENYRALEPGVSCVTLGSLCYKNSEGGYCQLEQSYSIEECQRHGGEALSDPGDLSLLQAGCPNGGHVLASIKFGVFIEGGLCCAPRS